MPCKQSRPMVSVQTPDKARLTRLLGGDSLANLRQRLRRRLVGSQAPTDAFTVTGLSAAEHQALAGLLGRPAQFAASMRLRHSEIDQALQRAELAVNLRMALETLDGPIIDHQAKARREQRAWQTVFEQIPPGPLADCLADSTFRGVVKRLAGGDPAVAAKVLANSARVLSRLPANGLSRSHLAAQMLGDAHALDNGRPVTTVLRRALDPTSGVPRMRDIWATQGVLVSELAKPVAVLNLAVSGDSAVDQLIATAARAAEPLHLSLRALLRGRPSWAPAQSVVVCENPDILTAAADALGPRCPAMASLDGQLSAAPRTLLDQLHSVGCKLYYHGDFDWPGLRIGNGIIQRYAAIPWLYSVEHYQPQHGPALGEEFVEAIWDSRLSAKMQAAGIAVHEESQLDDLLEKLEALAEL